MQCSIVDSVGEATVFTSTQTMRANDKLNVVFVGGITIPHLDNWRIRVRMRNSWYQDTWTSDRVNILVLGARR